MLLSKRFAAFVERSPVAVMARGVLERVFAPEHLNALYARTARVGYTRELLFSTTVGLMSEVVLDVSPSVHAAYKDAEEPVPVSVTALYEKLQGIETAVSAELVRATARQLAPVIERMGGGLSKPLAGYRVRILDGNHLAGTEHRIAELRRMRAAALPGQALVVLDPARMLVVDVLACEDAHAQERSLLDEILPMVQPKDLWIDDRNFCTSRFLFGIARRQAYFLVRQHASTLQIELLGQPRYRGKVPTGQVYEQAVRLTHPETHETILARRVTVELDQPTRDGDTEIHLLTNLPAEVSAAQVAILYGSRWTIEKAFQDLTTALVCEIHTLGYPKAALFGFCLALVAYNAVSLVKAALRSVHGAEKVEKEISWYYLCLHLAKVYTGMMIAIPAPHWRVFARMDDQTFADTIRALAAKIDWRRFRKHPRGPKKPQPPKISGAKIKHVSTARVLANRTP